MGALEVADADEAEGSLLLQRTDPLLQLRRRRDWRTAGQTAGRADGRASGRAGGRAEEQKGEWNPHPMKTRRPSFRQPDGWPARRPFCVEKSRDLGAHPILPPVGSGAFAAHLPTQPLLLHGELLVVLAPGIGGAPTDLCIGIGIYSGATMMRNPLVSPS